MVTRERVYNRALRQAVKAVNSNNELKQTLTSIVQSISQVFDAGVSLVLLDATRTKLVHSISWGLPYSYLHKGVLDVSKSLAEVTTGKPVIIADITSDKHVQYPEAARKSGIVSMLGVPLRIGNTVSGSIRVYHKKSGEFTKADVEFVLAMTNLVSVAIRDYELLQQNIKGTTSPFSLRTVSSVVFAHPSEQEFAHLLDFYSVEWLYEPRSFPLKWDGERIVEMFTPDFYLPELDLYVELTTLKQSLVTEKNRKLRRLRELNPDIKITLLYKKDFYHLLAKYGRGPLTETRHRGVDRTLYSAEEIQQKVEELARQISRDYTGRHPVLIGVLRGVFCFMADIVRNITIPLEVDFLAISYYNGGSSPAVKITKDISLDITGRHVIMVEDILDTGMTLNYVLKYLKTKEPASLSVCALLNKEVRRIADVHLDYVGFDVPDEFVVGYGLDFHEEYRNLPFIGVLGHEATEPLTVVKDGEIKEAPR